MKRIARHPNSKWAKQLGKRIAEVWRLSGLTQEALADACGVGRGSLIRWMQGASVPGGDNLAALAATTSVSVDWLLDGLSPAGVQDVRDAVYRGQWRDTPALARDLRAAVLRKLDPGGWAARAVAEAELDIDAIVDAVATALETWYTNRSRDLPITNAILSLPLADERTLAVLDAVLPLIEGSRKYDPGRAPYLHLDPARDPLFQEYRRVSTLSRGIFRDAYTDYAAAWLPRFHAAMDEVRRVQSSNSVPEIKAAWRPVVALIEDARQVRLPFPPDLEAFAAQLDAIAPEITE